MNKKPFSQIDFGLKKWVWYLIGIFLITASGLLFYSAILFSDGGVPWGSDTFGHIYRFEFLRHSLAEGIGTPDFFPNWYLGIQLFRYYPPILYYGLAGFSVILGDPVQAAFWGMFLIAWFGSLSWLFYQRWLGWVPSILGGILFYLLPDLIRVGFAEGNLLRHLANGLLPILFFFIFYLIKEEKHRNWMQVGLGLVLALMVVSHPMMAAISGTVTGILLLGAFLTKKINFRQLLSALLSAVLGILISAWWLFPSMSGGITELSSQAMIEGLPVVSFISLLNPLTRIENIEELYIGGSLILVNLGLFFFSLVRRKMDLWVIFISGLLICMLSTPILNGFYFSVPLSSLMWPSRFLTFASFLLLFSAIYGFSLLSKKYIVSVIFLFCFLIVDFGGSLESIRNRPANNELIQSSAYLSQVEGWRVATLDYSRVGSGPSYYFSEFGDREQLFGWGFQGARTAQLVSGINESLEHGLIAYTLDRLNLAGVDDVLVAEQVPQPYGLQEALLWQGYQEEPMGEFFSLYHRSGIPRAIEVNWPAIGIGTVAQNYAYLFPQIILADSIYIDDYALEDLMNYDLVVLAGFSWHDQAAAEELVIALSQTDTMVVVDLTKARENVYSQQPEFLGVWGERIILDQEQKTVSNAVDTYELSPMHNDGELWYTFTPQNLDVEVLSMGFLGQRLVLTGYNQYENGKVWFIGLNLAYHTVMNKDAEALRLLDDLLSIDQGALSAYNEVPFYDYEVNGSRIHFSYYLEEPKKLLLPFSCFDGSRVAIDGISQEIGSLSNLIVLDAPAGIHYVEITFEPTSIYLWGKLVSVLAILLFCSLNLFWQEKSYDEA